MSMIGDLLQLLAQSQQLSNNQTPLPQAINGLMGSGSGSGQASQLMGALEQMMAAGSQGAAPNAGLAPNDPALNMVQPIAEQLSRKTGLEPQAAQAVVSLIMHRMLTSHPAMGRGGSMNLAQVLQQMAASGSVPADVLHSSGMVNHLVQSGGMDQETALRNLNAAFSLLSGHMQNSSTR